MLRQTDEDSSSTRNVVIINVYTGTLTWMLTAPSYRFLANSVDDVAENEKIMPFAMKGNMAEDHGMLK
jgi:hypothetical protein